MWLLLPVSSWLINSHILMWSLVVFSVNLYCTFTNHIPGLLCERNMVLIHRTNAIIILHMTPRIKWGFIKTVCTLLHIYSRTCVNSNKMFERCINVNTFTIFIGISSWRVNHTALYFKPWSTIFPWYKGSIFFYLKIVLLGIYYANI